VSIQQLQLTTNRCLPFPAILLGLVFAFATPAAVENIGTTVTAQPGQSAVASTPVGVIEGRSEITASGEFRYTIPLQVPRGRAGIEPTLSLQYASRAGDGRVGMGWNLVGLPEIRRCTSTIATDGRTEGVAYNDRDRFCLDGQKLVLVRGEYGRNDSKYRTEEDSFARIIASRLPGETEPSSFRVWTKDGRILDFGGSRWARMMVNRAAATGENGALMREGYRTVAWTLAEMRDRVGNKIESTPSRHGRVEHRGWNRICPRGNYSGSHSITM
jgi:hypothetical protein